MRNRNVQEIHKLVASHTPPPNGDMACNPGMCPGWEWNQKPLGSQISTQSTEPHQPGHRIILLLIAGFYFFECGPAVKLGQMDYPYTALYVTST